MPALSAGGSSGTSPGSSTPYAGLSAGNTGRSAKTRLGRLPYWFRRHSASTLYGRASTETSHGITYKPQSGVGTFNFNRQFTQKNSVSTAVGVTQVRGIHSRLCCWAILSSGLMEIRSPMHCNSSTTAFTCRMTGACLGTRQSMLASLGLRIAIYRALRQAEQWILRLLPEPAAGFGRGSYTQRRSAVCQFVEPV
jgi:hypothetical protein